MIGILLIAFGTWQFFAAIAVLFPALMLSVWLAFDVMRALVLGLVGRSRYHGGR